METNMEDASTHLLLDKMAAILADGNFKCIFFNENDRIPIHISLKFVHRSPIDNESALVQVMAWRRTGDRQAITWTYRQVSNISRTLVGDKIVDHSDVVGASLVGAAPTTSSFST